MNQEALRKKIMDLVEGEGFFDDLEKKSSFIPGETPVYFALQNLGAEEFENVLQVLLSQRFVGARYTEAFERNFASFSQRNSSLFVNSGSSANLLALSALTSNLLNDRRLQPEDEVITVAGGFPTTVNPIIQNGLIPVFVDMNVKTLNVDVSQIEGTISKKTKAVMLAHTLGNPFDLGEIMKIKEKYDLYLIEDCCDALGSTYRGQMVGTFGELSTMSFYPAHHITAGEGGAVMTDSPLLARIVRSLRDWGRDCWCEPWKDNSCGCRFSRQSGTLPFGYDHKYVYSHIGYNLKATEFQAAIALAQLKKAPSFISRRKENFAKMSALAAQFEEFFILPEATPGSDPSWFAYPLTVRENAPFSRGDIVRFLESHKIMTRMMFGGNLTRQPGYAGIPCRISGPLEQTDRIMNGTFFIGLHPLMKDDQLAYIEAKLLDFCRGLRSRVNHD